MSVIDWDYGLKILKKKVVRVVFKKKGNGSYREMWATRNSELISNYIGASASERLGVNDRQKLKQQQVNNNLVVFDLEKEDFRTIPLINVEAVDPFTGYPGWVEFEISEPWDDIVSGKLRLEDYLI